MNEENVKEFLAAFPATRENELMSLHTYMKIGGPARMFLAANTGEEVVRAIELARALEIPWYVFGGGSNLLVSDDGFHGLVIQAAERVRTIDGMTVKVSAGYFSALLAKETADAGLAGFEWGAGVPGTIGGATYGNAGCFGGEMKDIVSTVDAYDVTRAKRVTYSNEDCRFGYRDSRFKHEPHILLQTTFELRPDDRAACRERIDRILSARKETQPQGAFSAGCLFKNFEYHDEAAIDVLKQKREIPHMMLDQKRIVAGWLVDTLGLKGKTIGNAQVSPVHGNFLVNLGGARAQDVIALSSYVKMKVRDELGILLEDEVQLLGF